MARAMTTAEMKKRMTGASAIAMEETCGMEQQKKSWKESGTLQNSNLQMQKQKRKIPYEELEAIAVTSVDVAKTLKTKCLELEAELDAEKNSTREVLEMAQEAIDSRDLIINRYEPKEIDNTILSELDELKNFTIENPRYNEILKRKSEEMQKKKKEMLLSRYNFAVRS